ncbi:hypothetical protein ACFE04_023151 [Oxalis oulophora]
MKTMETIEDLIEEAKLRTVWWALCIFAITYLLTHTSTSMWMNLPMAVLFVSAMRIIVTKVEFRWKPAAIKPHSYLTHLAKKQLSVNDSRLSNAPPPAKWKRKLDSPLVEAALNDLIDKILRDFVVDLWYSEITPDKEFPELIRATILDAVGEISGRVKEINLVDLLTRDIIDLVDAHLDLFRRNQTAIGVDVMGTLSCEERDERLKHHLMAAKELHPALISPESEYKFLQRLIGGVLAIVLRPREAQCPLIRSIAREIVTCLVVQPVLNFASPGYINEVIELVFLAINGDGIDLFGGGVHNDESTARTCSEPSLTKTEDKGESSDEDNINPRPADWARMLEAATQRRTEVLTPENLENLWTKGRNYKKKEQKYSKEEEKGLTSADKKRMQLCLDYSKSSSFEGQDLNFNPDDGNNNRLKKSNSTSDLLTGDGGGMGGLISEFYTADFTNPHSSQVYEPTIVPDILHNEGPLVGKLRCQVVGAYFEKVASKSFAVYSIAVTDAENRSWFVKRRYRNFELLHRHLKEIPNYTLHLPPKRIFSSSTEDAFVHQRCIQLDKYLQDLLSIANVAEQHEVWDFFSASSKNYAYGKSASVMRTLAVNVDDAVDDIVRQFKGGFMRKVVGPDEGSRSIQDELNHPKLVLRQNTSDTVNSFSDNEEAEKSCQDAYIRDNDLNAPGLVDESSNLDLERKKNISAGDVSKSLEDMPPEWTPPNVSVPILNLVDNVFQLKRRGWLRRQAFWISKQILQLIMEDAVDDFLLGQIYWLRREDTIAQGIHWLQDILWPGGSFFTRRKFDLTQSDQKPFQAFGKMASSDGGSFESQLEAARRASYVKKILFDGAPTALVSLIGNKQYKRCARDIYYFTQSTVCIKQLAYAILELLLISVFPELHDLVLDIHEKKDL